VRFGYRIGAFQGEGGVADRETFEREYREFLQPTDLRPFTVGCQVVHDAMDCSEIVAFVFVFYIDEDGDGIFSDEEIARSGLLDMVFARDRGGYMFLGAWSGHNDLNPGFVFGGDELSGVDPGEPSPTFTRYVPLR
jgi:hypothetical protein